VRIRGRDEQALDHRNPVPRLDRAKLGLLTRIDNVPS
jgi:hypothetical protein